MNKESRLLRVGVLGAGPIAQAAHFEACRKARNAELYAICDAAEDLLTKMAAIHDPRVTYNGYDAMLADPQVAARNMVVEVDDPTLGGFRVAGNPIKLSGFPDPDRRGPVPRLQPPDDPA